MIYKDSLSQVLLLDKRRMIASNYVGILVHPVHKNTGEEV